MRLPSFSLLFLSLPPSFINILTHTCTPQVQALAKKENPLLAKLPEEKRLAVELVKQMYFAFKGPMETLDKAGKAFLGLEALLGGQNFEVQGNIWRRQVRACALAKWRTGRERVCVWCGLGGGWRVQVVAISGGAGAVTCGSKLPSGEEESVCGVGSG